MYRCGCSTGSARHLAWGPDISPRWQKRGGLSSFCRHTGFPCLCTASGTGRLLVISTDPLATRWPGCWTTEIRRGSKRLRLRSSPIVIYTDYRVVMNSKSAVRWRHSRNQKIVSICFSREIHLISEFPKLVKCLLVCPVMVKWSLQNELVLEGPISHWTMELWEETLFSPNESNPK